MNCVPRSVAAIVLCALVAATALMSALGGAGLSAQTPTSPTAPPFTPPSPTPAPGPSQSLPLPGSATLPPFGRVTFVGPERTPPTPTPAPGQTPVPVRRVPPASITVQSFSDQPADVTAVEGGATIAVAEGRALRATVVGPTLQPCNLVDGQPNVVICPTDPGRAPTLVQFTSVTASQRTEMVALAAGCNNVSATWPSGTPTSEVAAAVSPSEALVAIWRFDALQGRFAGFSPGFLQASDLTTINRLDAVFICMDEPGTLTRPAS